ncbi:hypothetical protein GGR93_003672 [Sulfitobacter noctilucicola]|uniref:Uncharacterized protein n=1 Tax=Sulfitobacter noctilucicola TaxID=1342301 RepID=A0A7W6MBB4_9RHOB|nr:hypothetical protein [Sulfitobacter noctilucicola]
MPHFPSCARSQHKIIMAESGSLLTFAATYSKVCSGLEGDFHCTRPQSRLCGTNPTYGFGD